MSDDEVVERVKRAIKDSVNDTMDEYFSEAHAETAARAAIAAMPGWQPIDANTPKMKTLLLWAITDVDDDGNVHNWKMETGYWNTGYDNDEKYSPWEWGGRRQLAKYETQPTHWRHLPAPPEAKP